MRKLLAGLLLAILGCVSVAGKAHMIAPAAQPSSPNAPVNEQDRTGVIRYLPSGASRYVTARREDAYRQMRESCKGPYRILREGEETHAESDVTSTGGIVSGSVTYWYIYFTCAAQRATGHMA